MTTKTKSRILEAVHESASDLHRLGFIDKRKMQRYDALCLEPVQDYDAEKVAAAKEVYEGKDLEVRSKTALLEQLGALTERLKNPKASDETKAKTKNQIATLEFVFGLRESL